MRVCRVRKSGLLVGQKTVDISAGSIRDVPTVLEFRDNSDSDCIGLFHQRHRNDCNPYSCVCCCLHGHLPQSLHIRGFFSGST